jgi:type VI secretion system secreted protein VgrG
MPGFTQESRLFTLTTPLGEDVLLLSSFAGTEAISRPFSFDLSLLSQQAPIAFTDIVGQNVTLTINNADGGSNYINGIVSRFGATGAKDGFTTYEMEVVPWTWLLTRSADCKIYHNQAVGDIITAVFEDFGFTDYSLSLTAAYPTLEYCVQYRETAFNFISRLMEQYGIFYFYKHSEGKHTMVIADSPSAIQDCPGQATISYRPPTENGRGNNLEAEDTISSWSLEQLFMTGNCTLSDYYFETPSANLVATEATIDPVANNSSFEIFDYPGDYTVRSDGADLVKVRMEEQEALHLVGKGSANCRNFSSGFTFTLADHFDPSMNASYLLTEIHHAGSVGGSYAIGGEIPDSYSNHFTCIPAGVPFRPARVTPKPFVQGPQSATVVGASANPGANSGGGGDGEEIWVDKYGRVMVLFPWDRKADCSCWLRVSQDWAGQGWGSITIPRVGQEVLVSFIEGDPDRPIITGRVYNATQTVPYALPDNGTRSTFMTRSSKGGSSSTYNELRFEDKTGSEQVFLRAQFDQDNRVLNDSREWVGNNRSLVVTQDQMESVGGDLHAQITGNLNQKVGQSLSIQVGQNLYEKSGTNFAHQAGQMIHLKAGMTIVLEAETEISLVVGGNFITIDATGVSITGTMVNLNSGGSAGSGCGSSPTDPTKPDKADDGSKGTKLD